MNKWYKNACLEKHACLCSLTQLQHLLAICVIGNNLSLSLLSASDAVIVSSKTIHYCMKEPKCCVASSAAI